MRLAEGQIRHLLADRTRRSRPDAARSRRREIEPRHAGPAANGKARSRAAASGLRRMTGGSMTAPAAGSDCELVLTRLIAAPPRNLYRAWTEPELLKQW